MDTPERRTVQPPATAATDPVERAGIDSFPASDPPSWIAADRSDAEHAALADHCPLDAPGAPKLTDVKSRLSGPS